MDHSVSLEDTSASREVWNRQLSNEKPMTVVEGREWLRQSMQPEALRIAGVTFKGRQELVAKLQPGMFPLPWPAAPEHLPASRIECHGHAHRAFACTLPQVRVLSSSAADQALMLQKDPSNEYDPNAIKVMTLSGSVLGFVPRELTSRFPYDTTFGHAYHIGQVPDKGTWGALVMHFCHHFCCLP